LLLSLLDAVSGSDLESSKKAYPNIGRLVSGDYRVSTLQYLADECLYVVGDDEYRASRWQHCYDSLVPSASQAISNKPDLPAGLLSGSSQLSMTIDNLATTARGMQVQSPLTQIISPSIASSMLSFIWSPSLQDAFSLQIFCFALSSLGLQGAWRLHCALPLLLQYFERLPFLKLSLFMTTTSPIQR
jgi:hypothetical protein